VPELAVAETEDLPRPPPAIDEAHHRRDLRGSHDLPVDAGGLEDAHDLVVHDGRARQVVGLARLVEGDDRHPEVVEQQREELAHRAEPADEHVAVGHHTGTAVGLIRLVSVPIPSISSSTVCPGWIQRSTSRPQQPGIVPVEITSPASSFSPADA
jgi:hypothetical protein